MPSNYLILCCFLLLLSSIFHSIRVFSNESVLWIRWPRYWSTAILCNDLYGKRIFKKVNIRRCLTESLCCTAETKTASLVVQMVKNPPTMRDSWVRSLRWEDPLEGKMRTHSSILTWNPMDRGAWRATAHGVAELDTTKRLRTAQHSMLSEMSGKGKYSMISCTCGI